MGYFVCLYTRWALYEGSVCAVKNFPLQENLLSLPFYYKVPRYLYRKKRWFGPIFLTVEDARPQRNEKRCTAKRCPFLIVLLEKNFFFMWKHTYMSDKEFISFKYFYKIDVHRICVTLPSSCHATSAFEWFHYI